MHSLVTGGTGFIGSHLTERLPDDGHAVDTVKMFHGDAESAGYSIDTNHRKKTSE